VYTEFDLVTRHISRLRAALGLPGARAQALRSNCPAATVADCDGDLRAIRSRRRNARRDDTSAARRLKDPRPRRGMFGRRSELDLRWIYSTRSPNDAVAVEDPALPVDHLCEPSGILDH
jgi:hypothetical protein